MKVGGSGNHGDKQKLDGDDAPGYEELPLESGRSTDQNN